METLFLTVNLFDNYLTKTKDEERISCLGSIVVACILIAAKLEEPITPNFNNMCKLLERLDLVKIDKTTLFHIET